MPIYSLQQLKVTYTSHWRIEIVPPCETSYCYRNFFALKYHRLVLVIGNIQYPVATSKRKTSSPTILHFTDLVSYILTLMICKQEDMIRTMDLIVENL